MNKEWPITDIFPIRSAYIEVSIINVHGTLSPFTKVTNFSANSSGIFSKIPVPLHTFFLPIVIAWLLLQQEGKCHGRGESISNVTAA